MLEIFEQIIANPGEFFTAIGISSASFFCVVKALSYILELLTKSSKLKKEHKQHLAQASLMLQMFGENEGISKKTEENVKKAIAESKTIKSLENIVKELRELSLLLAQADSCPIELKAYINTVLSQDGAEDLLLEYEKTKGTLVTSEDKEEKVEPEVVEPEVEVEEVKAEEVEEDKTKKDVPLTNVDEEEEKKEDFGEISYA